MCGIAGIIGEGSNIESLRTMLKTQEHRGPDDTGMFSEERAVLGHNRLAIIDLTKESNQPFISNDERYILVFNGEIYNYIELKQKLNTAYEFKTKSDSEVLLAAYSIYGSSCLSMLKGMFSFAIWDKKEQQLFAARDRFGVKPLYYALQGDTCYFASEIKAFHSIGIGKEFNEGVWSMYFKKGFYGYPNQSFYKDIHQLPGSHWLTFKNGKLHIEKWYDFTAHINSISNELNTQEIENHYISLLQDSLTLRFRSDVPVGFNISGGLDSSTLLLFVNKIASKNINAFTFYTNDERYDELPWVEQMIALTQNPLHKVLLEAESIPKLASEQAYYQDEPFGGIPTLAYAEIFKKAGANNIIVLLDGQGMDEQWAGYDYYHNNSKQTIQGVSKSPFRPNCLNTDFKNSFQTTVVYPKPFNNEMQNMQYRDLFYTKIPRALRFNDRVSMAASTELREPFLDDDLVAFAFAQKPAYKIQDGQTKFLLRKIVSKHLSNTITYAPKRPLQTPQREWLGDELQSFVSEQLTKLLDSEYAKWFDKDNLKNEWNKYIAGDRDASFHIWQWVNTSLLIR